MAHRKHALRTPLIGHNCLAAVLSSTPKVRVRFPPKPKCAKFPFQSHVLFKAVCSNPSEKLYVNPIFFHVRLLFTLLAILAGFFYSWGIKCFRIKILVPLTVAHMSEVSQQNLLTQCSVVVWLNEGVMYLCVGCCVTDLIYPLCASLYNTEGSCLRRWRRHGTSHSSKS